MHQNGNGSPSSPMIGAERAAADPYDALADLFLGGGDGSARRPGALGETGPDPASLARHGNMLIECLVLGHLPVLGAPWSSQYARSLAQSTGEAVANAIIRGGHLTIEVIGATEVLGGPSSEPLEAARRAARVATRWLVRTDDRVADLAAAPQVGALTLITAADQASVVGSYAALKRILESSTEVKTVRLAIMAAAPEAADAAYARLAEAVRSFAGRGVERAPGAQRIAPTGPGAVLFSGPLPVDVSALPAMIAAASRGGTIPPKAPAHRVETPIPMMAPPAAPAPPATPALQAAPPTAPAVTASASGAPPCLASLVPGLTPLAVRCPYAPDVELASGVTAGMTGLHLLVRAGPGAFEALAAAGAWSRAHVGLLRTAGVPASEEAEPAHHIIVDDARPVRRLLETGVRVHLVAPMSEATRTGWLCRPLN